MQTILGAGGIIASEIAKALPAYTDRIRLVSRNPQRINPTDELISADLTDRDSLFKAVEGSSIVYVTIGFPYDTSCWQSQWPPFIHNVVAACQTYDCKLVFFDNIYMYDPERLNPMTEDTPYRPSSKKGQVRAALVKQMMDEMENGRLTALIARSADFYGPGIASSSLLNETVFKPLHAGKKANWMCSVNHKHSFTYTPDSGRATALLGNTVDAYNQVWHLPTASKPFTGKEWIEAIAQAMDKPAKYQVAPKLLVRIMGWFMPIMKEMVEMLYQYDRDYVFNSDKFEKRFHQPPTPYLEGIKRVIKADFSGA